MDGLGSCIFFKFLLIKLDVTIGINVRSQPARQTAVN